MVSLFSNFVFSAKLSLVDVQFLSQNPDPVEPGKLIELRWRISNNGGKDSKYIF